MGEEAGGGAAVADEIRAGIDGGGEGIEGEGVRIGGGFAGGVRGVGEGGSGGGDDGFGDGGKEGAGGGAIASEAGGRAGRAVRRRVHRSELEFGLGFGEEEVEMD
ncbi:hypothetical protein DsansV1_C18g0152321 [Dioscorea sansibarensis]